MPAPAKIPYGLAECGWKIEDGAIEVMVVVPPNTTARVTLPGKVTEPVEVGSGEYRWVLPARLASGSLYPGAV